MGDRIGDEDDLLAGTEEAVVMGDEAELLEGTEEAVVMGDEEELLEATEEAAAEAAAEAAELAAMQQRRAQASGEGVEETSVEETMETLEDVMSPVLREGADGRFVGKRKIKEYTWSPDVMIGVDPNDEAERAKREARAAKFGVPLKEASPAVEPMAQETPQTFLTAEEVAAREERAKKFGVEPVGAVEMIERVAPKVYREAPKSS